MEALKNLELFKNEIESKLPNYNKLDFLVVGIKGDAIIKDCTKILLDDKIRMDYKNNELIKV